MNGIKSIYTANVSSTPCAFTVCRVRTWHKQADLMVFAGCPREALLTG